MEAPTIYKYMYLTFVAPFLFNESTILQVFRMIGFPRFPFYSILFLFCNLILIPCPIFRQGRRFCQILISGIRRPVITELADLAQNHSLVFTFAVLLLLVPNLPV